MQVVGPIHVVAGRIPLIEIDAAEIDDPEQRRQVVDHREVDDVAGVVRDPAGADPVRPRRGGALHEEELAGGAVGIPLHHHRAIGDVREQQRGHVGVVLDQVAFGDAALGPEQFVEVGEPDIAAIDAERGGSRPRNLRRGHGQPVNFEMPRIGASRGGRGP